MSVDRDYLPAMTARVGLDVIGWRADQSDVNEPVAEAVCAYAKAAVLAGLDGDEIAFDITERWGAALSEVWVEVTRGFRTCRAHVFALAAVVPMAHPAAAAPVAMT